MLFNSVIFIFLFLPITVAGYFFLARFGRRPALGWLISASLFFYAWWSVAFLPLLLGSILFNYGMSELIGRTQRARLQNALLTLAIVVDLGALAYYKYLFAIVQTLNTHLGLSFHFDEIALPIGISFFTFTQIGYLLDVKQGMTEERGFLNYIMFVTFFPHLVAGPILHNREMMPQYADEKTYRVSASNISIGLALFVMGLAKKTLLADPHSAAVASGFAHTGALSAGEAWHVVLSYSLQLYFDFSGYSDMAIGLARIFNVTFPVNFNSPFKSASIIEYWQRWHITLTNYLNLYLYNPMAMWVSRWRMDRDLDVSRKALATRGGFASMVLFPTFATMGIAGVWHGAGLQFLIFGLLHASYLSINNAWRVYRAPAKKATKGQPEAAWKRPAKVLLTYLSVIVAVIFFRAPSTEAALQMLSAMFGANGLGSFGGANFSRGELLVLLLSYFIIWGLPNTQQILMQYAPVLEKVTAGRPARLQWNPTAAWAAGLGVLAACAVLATGGTSEFLYFQF
jgi:alginate O-acetyltransferase complex protein AlgI